MLIHDIFSSFVIEDKFNLDLEDLKNYCIGNIDSNNQPVRFGVPEFQPLIVRVNEYLNNLHTQMGLSPNYKQEVYKVWFNVGFPEEIIKPHCHPESFFSTVFYLTGDDNSGKISFMNPVVQKTSVVQKPMIGDFNKYWRENAEVAPSPNLLLVFPSWLWHYVTPGSGTEPRISIAIDSVIRKK